MTTSTGTGTALITGPAREPARALTPELAGRAESDRPGLLPTGRPGKVMPAAGLI
jgi:hypothetical protein